MIFEENQSVLDIFKNYPDHVRGKMLNLRNLVIETAKETEGVSKLLETLKWGEPSYLAKGGSTVRMDWKSKKPEQYALYFICNTNLVNNFKIIIGDQLNYEGSRAIIFSLDQELPIEPIKKCLSLAFRYHKVKNLPMLDE